MHEVIKKGIWYYDDIILKHLVIIKQDWDYYYEEGYDDYPNLNDRGEAFYIIFDIFDEARSKTCFSIEEAIALANEIIIGIKWSK